MMEQKAVLSWSTGKDSAWSLYALRQQGVEVVGLFSSLTGPENDRKVTMHGVDRAVVQAQAAAAGLPLEEIFLPDPCPNEVYEEVMGAFIAPIREKGVTHVAFGDLFLEDIRQYREDKLSGTGFEPIFPLWGQNTQTLARAMIAGGLEARVVSVDTDQLDGSFIGRAYDEAFLRDLPDRCDPCGENGEFHTVCFAGPMFQSPVDVVLGDVNEGERYWHQRASLA
ncbi:MAG: ATP-binding protein [Rhodospirillales bacterium]